jgi:hypothetical protein
MSSNNNNNNNNTSSSRNRYKALHHITSEGPFQSNKQRTSSAKSSAAAAKSTAAATGSFKFGQPSVALGGLRATTTTSALGAIRPTFASAARQTKSLMGQSTHTCRKQDTNSSDSHCASGTGRAADGSNNSTHPVHTSSHIHNTQSDNNMQRRVGSYDAAKHSYKTCCPYYVLHTIT